MSERISNDGELINDESQVPGGYVKLYRSIRTHWIWKEPHDRFHAFQDLILSANFADVSLQFDGQPLFLKRGQFVTSELKLSESWQWSRPKVHRFLEILVEQKMIEIRRFNKGTIVTVSNYDKFQSRASDITADSTADVTPEKQQTLQQACTDNEFKELKEHKEQEELLQRGRARTKSVFIKDDKDLQEHLSDCPSLNTDNIRKLLVAWIDGPRKAKRAPLSVLTLKEIVEEYKHYPELLVSDLNLCLENGWQGLKWAKVRRESDRSPTQNSNPFSQNRAGQIESPEAKEIRMRAMAKAAEEENRKIAASRKAMFTGRP